MGSKIVFRALWILILSTGIVNESYATHGMGGDITYQCLGPDSFRVRLSLYMDCTGSGNFGFAEDIELISSCGDTLAVTVLRLPGSGRDITPLCPGSSSPCSGTSTLPLGVLEHIYEATVKLPPGNCTWDFTYTVCCRNYTITNLQNPGNERIYLSAQLVQGVGCNSSPQFLNEPVPFICVWQPFNYNHGASDPDGDSLRFSLVHCSGENGVDIPFVSPYTLSDPLSTANGVTVDPATGAISFVPDVAQVAVLCMKVEEYRNGLKIGEVVRDLQIVVTGCNNPPPIASGVNGGSDYTLIVCSGETPSFNINSIDPDPAQSITMSWNQGIPGATFTVTPGQHPKGMFHWIPPDTARGTFFFTVTVQDDGCPSVSTNVFTYQIELVDNPTVEAGGDTGICAGAAVQIQATSISNGTYHWEPAAEIADDPDIPSPLAAPTVDTWYYVMFTDSNGCTAWDSLLVTVDPALTIDAWPDVQEIQKGGQALLYATPGYAQYVWVNATDNTIISNSEQVTVSPEESTVYYLTVTSAAGCEGVDSVRVLVDGGIWVPTGFSPNGDGRNDWFYLEANAPIEVVSFRVYNRWGVLVFESKGFGSAVDKGWNGVSSGVSQPVGVYVYVIEGFQLGSVEAFLKKGNVTLLR